jgi:hypothetical protein
MKDFASNVKRLADAKVKNRIQIKDMASNKTN